MHLLMCHIHWSETEQLFYTLRQMFPDLLKITIRKLTRLLTDVSQMTDFIEKQLYEQSFKNFPDWL